MNVSDDRNWKTTVYWLADECHLMERGKTTTVWKKLNVFVAFRVLFKAIKALAPVEFDQLERRYFIVQGQRSLKRVPRFYV